MPISLNPSMMRAIIMDHYQNPRNRREEKDPRYETIHMDSSSCIDDIFVQILVENDVIKDCCFHGVACTISTASTSIMTELLIGKTKEEANYIIKNYINMINEQPFDDSVLNEALVFINTSKQASRIKCATIGYRACEELLKEGEKDDEKNSW